MNKNKFGYCEIGSDGLALNSDIQKAIEGLSGKEYELKMIFYKDIVLGEYENIKQNPFVCSFNTMKKLFLDNEIKIESIDYPDEIKKFIKRKIELFTIEKLLPLYENESVSWSGGGYYRNCIIKPYITKQFGVFWLNDNNLSFLKSFGGDTKVWVSPLIDIESEWRVFVHKGEVVGSSCYRGNFKVMPEYDYVNAIVAAYKSSPIAYTLDIGVLTNKSNDIIEVNDFWGIGSYGLNPERYAAMLIDRYFEIVNNVKKGGGE